MKDSHEWILRTVRRIIRESGPVSAKRFLASRGGPAKWEAASREVARAFREAEDKRVLPVRHFIQSTERSLL